MSVCFPCVLLSLLALIFFFALPSTVRATHTWGCENTRPVYACVCMGSMRCDPSRTKRRVSWVGLAASCPRSRGTLSTSMRKPAIPMPPLLATTTVTGPSARTSCAERTNNRSRNNFVGKYGVLAGAWRFRETRGSACGWGPTARRFGVRLHVCGASVIFFCTSWSRGPLEAGGRFVGCEGRQTREFAQLTRLCRRHSSVMRFGHRDGFRSSPLLAFIFPLSGYAPSVVGAGRMASHISFVLVSSS